ncbi:MAG: crossover junction endodeoxyribonuclease RuvC [Armatimonadetes bacterium]|nr:crossover junction endodeoxyribonuclease RuvC [Armatimonadota bacterium]
MPRARRPQRTSYDKLVAALGEARAVNDEQPLPLTGEVTIIGIDPGTAILGYGIIRADASRCVPVAFGAIRTTPSMSKGERLCAIHEGLSRVLAEHAPDVMAVERLFFQKNVRTAMAVGEARGVVLLAAAQHGVGFYEYTPTDVKMSLSGSGRADKHEVGQMVAWALDLAEIPRPDDVADALGIALCHLYRARLR